MSGETIPLRKAELVEQKLSRVGQSIGRKGKVGAQEHCWAKHRSIKN